jgi:hypothetical protein
MFICEAVAESRQLRMIVISLLRFAAAFEVEVQVNVSRGSNELNDPSLNPGSKCSPNAKASKRIHLEPFWVVHRVEL